MHAPSTTLPHAAFARADLPEQKDERRQLILRAAAEEIASLGSGKDFTINSLAKRAGLAKGTVYLYFSSKSAILLELLIEATDLLTSKLITAISILPPPVSARDLAREIEASFNCLEESRQYSCLFKSISLDSAGREQFHEHAMPSLEKLDALLRQRFPQLREGEGMEIIFFSWALRLGHYAIQETKHECRDDVECLPKVEPATGLIRLIEGYLFRPQ
ncbi:hypothetical protein DB346_01235 [Verrucomicrobia bacterium LW23]|nr:hypothetical protein DB346_01235 [Verrucomicrobia bacterium LW23]